MYVTKHDRLQHLDFAAHNQDVHRLWRDFKTGSHKRIPIILGTNTRFFMLDPRINNTGVTFRDYSEDPAVMFDMQLAFQRWQRFNLMQDQPLGTPSAWQITVDLQNYYEAAWFGCELYYADRQVPDVRPRLDAVPEDLLAEPPPQPFCGIMAKGLELFEYFTDRSTHAEYLDRPVQILPPTFGIGTDGVFTTACNILGPERVCTWMALEPERLEPLFRYITDATIERMKAWRRLTGIPVPQAGFGWADDSIALISTAMYRRHVLPHHLALLQALATDAPRSIHLCGDATRHFKTIRDELNVQSFDTGFPVDFAWLRRELGPGVTIQGGPPVARMQAASPTEIIAEVRDILASGILEGGRFVLREGNNLAPGTPLENCDALYQAGRAYGELH